MTAVDWAIGILLAGATWGALFGFAAAKTRKNTSERRQLRRSAERAAGER